MSDERLTCLVPTHNRPQFLRRLLHFYSQFSPGFSILVIDSSNPSAAAENVSVINDVREGLQVSYRHVDLNFIDKCVEGLQSVTTPFVVFCADDDLLFPDAVRPCVEFLGNHPEFASAMGRSVLLNTTLPRWRGKLKVIKGYSIEHDRPLDRCRQIAAQWFSNFYAVHRTENLLDDFRITAANSDSHSTFHLPEMSLLHLSVLRGRVKVLPLMYSLIERHGTNTGRMTLAAEQPQAEVHYQRFKASLAKQFERVGTDRMDAERFIDDWYGHYHNTDLASWQRRVSTVERIHRVLCGIVERAVDFVWTDRVRHCRAVRASDIAGGEAIWRAAVDLITEFPHGIPADQCISKRCA